MKTLKLSLLLLIGILFACSSSTAILEEDVEQIYYPESSTQWSQISIDELGWNAAAADDLLDFLEQENSRGFILLKEGKIVLESYWGTEFLGGGTFDRDSRWIWNSASKSLTSFLAGQAVTDHLLELDAPSSNYLGENWTSLSREQEAAILVKHHLSMSTGLNYNVPNLNCRTPECLTYGAVANEQWYYHNGPYHLLHPIIEVATGTSIENYTQSKVLDAIGMNGTWFNVGEDELNIFFSDTRDAAMFGWLCLNEGKWKDNQLIDQNYFRKSIQPSQIMNPSYGYLWWLNGQDKIILPGYDEAFNRSISTTAPADMYAAIGKDSQVIAIVPSEEIVVVRFGEAPTSQLIGFQDALWEKINALIN